MSIVTNQLGKRYWPRWVLKDFSLTVPQGSISALLGPNGAGKTTLLRILAGLITPSKGSASILGSDVTRLKPADWQRIAYVSESQRLPSWMTLEDLIAYCKPLYDHWDDDFLKRLLTDFDLPSKQKLRSFSRGMRMKAALLVSLAPRPSVLLLDEPFTGLDPLVREELIGGLLDWSGQEGWSVLLASHDLEEVERLADGLALIDHGSLALNESVEDLQMRHRAVKGSIPAGAQPAGPIPESWQEFASEGGRFAFTETSFQNTEKLQEQIKHLFPVDDVTFDATPMGLRQIYLNAARALKQNFAKAA